MYTRTQNTNLVTLGAQGVGGLVNNLKSTKVWGLFVNQFSHLLRALKSAFERVYLSRLSVYLHICCLYSMPCNFLILFLANVDFLPEIGLQAVPIWA